MRTKGRDSNTVATLLSIVAALSRGDRHSRGTIAAATGKSLQTADRWIGQIVAALPSCRRVRDGKTTWIMYERRQPPSSAAAAGACVAASLGALFEGSQQERNLKDVRDGILHERGDRIEELDRKFVFAPRGGEIALPEKGPILDAVIGALLANRRLRVRYAHNSGRVETVTIDPLSLVIYDHQFYVLAKQRGADGLYPYRFARMELLDQLDDSFAYPSKGEYDPKSILAQGFGIHTSGSGPVEDVEVVLSGAWATFALTHRWHPSQRARSLDDGRVCVTLQVRVCPELETWILSFGEHAQVVKPGALANEIAARVRRAATQYARPGPTLAKAPTRRRADPLAKKRARR